MTPEKKVQNQIIDFLENQNNLVYERRQAGGFNYRAGLPDVWFVFNGRHCEVEVKAPGGVVGSLQLKHEAAFKQAGSLYWRGDSFSDFLAWFNFNFPPLH